MHFVVEAFGEQRANRAVNQAAGERFVLRRLGFALEKAAGDLAGGIGFLNVVHRQREKVLARFGRFGSHHSGEHHGAVHIEQHGAGGLASDFAGFHAHRMTAPLEGFGDFIKHRHGR